MIYKEFEDLKLSTLGYGAMRLPVNGSTRKINEENTSDLIDHAYKNGVNFFDTSFFYHSGESEKVLGKMLARYPRDTWYLSDKFPGNFIEIVNGKLVLDIGWAGIPKMTFKKPADIFEYQLKNCGVDYFDFYMLHNVSEGTYDIYTDEKVGIVKYLLEQKKNGRIRHLGFSSHGRYETIDRFLDNYDCFEFVLIQLNYLDWTLQEAGKKYDVITKHGLPVFVMEPVRGGMLAAPGKDAETSLKAARPNDTPANWAFRFLQSLPNVAVVFSGMTTMEQLKENIEIFNKYDPLTEPEKEVLQQVVNNMAEFVPCTSCRYCCDLCPKQLDIPMLLATFNEASHGMSWYVADMLESLADDKKPQACTGCGVCTPLCPQNIDIADVMKKFCSMLA